MALSSDEKALAEAAYTRIRYGYRAGISGGLMGGVMGTLPTTIRHINDPHTSHRSAIFFAGLLGLVFGACLVASFFFSRQRKRDEELVRFFGDRFPEDCSWKQEEKILAQAEDLRLKAKVDYLIHKGA